MYDTVNMVRTISFNRDEVEKRASELGLTLTDAHWDAINFVKKFYDYHEDEALKLGDYNNALKGRYAKKGGLKYLYSLFPDGPINSVTQLAGISVDNIQDHSMGSVH